jgi:hypothetical protein
MPGNVRHPASQWLAVCLTTLTLSASLRIHDKPDISKEYDGGYLLVTVYRGPKEFMAIGH